MAAAREGSLPGCPGCHQSGLGVPKQVDAAHQVRGDDLHA